VTELSARDIIAARAAARQYRLEARRLRLAAEEAAAANRPLHVRALRYMAKRVDHAADSEMQAIEQGTVA
jgi:hypothetical protein